MKKFAENESDFFGYLTHHASFDNKVNQTHQTKSSVRQTNLGSFRSIAEKSVLEDISCNSCFD